MPLTSTQHAKLAEIYGKPNSDLSPEEVQRRQLLSRYHSMLSKTALKRELLKANSNTDFPVTVLGIVKFVAGQATGQFAADDGLHS